MEGRIRKIVTYVIRYVASKVSGKKLKPLLLRFLRKISHFGFLKWFAYNLISVINIYNLC